MTTWPPDLPGHKAPLGVNDARDNTALQQALTAAVAYVTRAKGDRGFFDANADTVLGTLMLASRLKSRSRSPDGVITMGELGTSTVPAYDADIEKLLEIGRWGGSVIV